MAVAYACPHCGMSYTLHDSLVGKSVRCKRCAQISTVAGSTPSLPASAGFTSTDLYGVEAGPALDRKAAAELDDEVVPWRAAPIGQKASQGGGNDTSKIITITVGVVLALGMTVFFALVAARVNHPVRDQGNLAPRGHAKGAVVPPPGPIGPRTQTRATLSNARVISRPGPGGHSIMGTSFSVDYRFEGDGPRPGEMYVWVIESRRGKARQMLVGAQPSGSLQGSVPTMQPNEGPFSTYLAVQHGAWLQKVSDTVTMQMSTEPTASASGAIPTPNARPSGMPPIPPGFGRRPTMPPMPRPPGFGPRGPRGPRFGPGRMRMP